jgi:ribonucleotide reductase alpha subunit
MDDMTVKKRDGTVEPVEFDKIMRRVKVLGQMEPALNIKYAQLVMKIIDQLRDGIDTTKLDELTAQECANQSSSHPDFGVLASRIIVSNNHKNTEASLEAVTAELLVKGLISTTYAKSVTAHVEEFTAMLDFSRDYSIDYFGFKTLERAYLMRVDGVIVERPQHMWMRVAIALHASDVERVRETYDLMSRKVFTHATPTLFNAGTPRPQLSSCFLLAMAADSIDGIYETVADCAKISKWAGGIGLHIHNVRATGSTIQGTNGTSNGLVPMLRVFNETARYVDQGGGKRNGSFAIYLGPEHPDIESWLDLKKNTGDEHARARDLFYGLWIPDLFMKRVKANAQWSLFCPHKCPGLADAVGDAYGKLYEQYEAEGRATKTVSARALWFKVLDAQMETGTPSLLYKDACNLKSNQQNLGTIKSSNLCTEIIEYSNAEETAVCNLASIALSAFVGPNGFDYAELHRVTRVVTRNLNRVIDTTYYPTEKTRRSNARHRPIGIGVQGLADAFILLRVPFHSEAARDINKRIFETMYHAAMSESVLLAKEHAACEGMNVPVMYSADFDGGDKYHALKPIRAETQRASHHGAYSSFVGSPLSEGVFQFNLWGIKPVMYDWGALRDDVMRYGARNSLLLAPMPTASTAQILGNNECFEPLTSNLYSRRTLAGEFAVVNSYLVRDLIQAGVWDADMKNAIIAHHGSVQQLPIAPALKELYKTVWEIPMKHVIQMSADRAPFICQSQSLNLWVEEPTYAVLTSMHFFSWEQGLKTGMYYLRRKPRYQPQQVTVEPCLTCSA